MPKLPVISYKELIKLLTQLGYAVERQRGSHIRLKKFYPPDITLSLFLPINKLLREPLMIFWGGLAIASISPKKN